MTGAPKTWAMQFIEDHEETPRRWYGGAVGKVGFDGSMNTGLTLRTAHIAGGTPRSGPPPVRLCNLVPAAEEKETHIKARALLETLDEASRIALDDAQVTSEPVAVLTRDYAPRVLLVDHQDSFVHTLGDYFRQQGAEVITLRFGFSPALLDSYAPNLVGHVARAGAPRRTSAARPCWTRSTRGTCPPSASAWACRPWSARAGRCPCSPSPRTASRGSVQVSGGSLLSGLPAARPRGSVPQPVRAARRGPRRVRRDRLAAVTGRGGCGDGD